MLQVSPIILFLYSHIFTHYAFKINPLCFQMHHYAQLCLPNFFLPYTLNTVRELELDSKPGSPDSPLSNSVSLALAPLSTRRLDQDAQPWPRGPWSPDSTTWHRELIIHCACILRWPKNRPLLCFSSRNKCPLC